MAIDTMFTDASIAMTVISLATFIGILWWVYGIKRSADFDAIARLPLIDDIDDRVGCNDAGKSAGDAAKTTERKHHV